MSRLESDVIRNNSFEVKPEPAMPPVSSQAYSSEFGEAAKMSFDFEDAELSTLLDNAQLLMSNGEYRPASYILIAALRQNSYSKEASVALAECFGKLENWPHAMKIYKIAFTRWPSVDLGLAYAESLTQMSDLTEAMEVYRELLLRPLENSELFEIYKSIGNIFVRQQDYESAEENYNRAFALNPKSDVLLVNYGTLEVQRGQMQSALERYREAIDLNTNNSKAWVGLALMHRHFGDLELSWANLESALDYDSSNKVALQLLSEYSVKDQKVAKAIPRFQTYLEHNDQDAVQSLVLAKLFYINGSKIEARTEVERALNVDPHIEGGVEFLKALELGE